MVCRSVWLAEIDLLVGRQRVGSRRGPVSRWWVASSVVDVAGELDPRVDQHDQVVADPLEVGDQVRGQHDAELVLGDGLHQVLQELAPGERVEAGDRLVEDQQLGALGEPRVSASWARWPPESLPALCAGSRPSRSIRAARQGVVPARVEVGAEPQVVGDAQPGVGGRVLGDEADLGQLLRVGRRAAAAAPRSCPRSASAARRRG